VAGVVRREPSRKMDGPDLSKLIYMLIIGGIVAGIGFYSIKNLLDLARLTFGETSSGKIVRKRIDSDDGRFHYVTYAFKDTVGRAYEREIQIGRQAYAELADHQVVKIVYQPENPSNSYLADARFRKSYLMSICGLLLFGAFLAYIAYNFVTYCVVLDACPAGN
jgi:hypothetical protein